MDIMSMDINETNPDTDPDTDTDTVLEPETVPGNREPATESESDTDTVVRCSEAVMGQALAPVPAFARSNCHSRSRR